MAPDQAPTPPTKPPVVGREIPCRHCGGALEGVPFGGRCPRCGTPVVESIRAHHTKDSDASLALLLGTLSLIAPILGLLLAPMAVIFFSRALGAYERQEIRRGAFNLALVGLAMAAAGVVVSLLVLVALGGAVI